MNTHTVSKKFHTLSIKRYHITSIVPEEMTIRQLLAAYMQISSMYYRNEEEIWKICEEMYDYSFSVKSEVYGSFATFFFQANAIHPDFVSDENYTLERIFEVFDELSSPLITENGFDEATFIKAKRLLKSNLEKQDKYPEYKATRLAISEFFKGTQRDYDVSGDLKTLKDITKEDLYQYYLKFVNEETGTFTIGDFEKNPLEYPFTLLKHPSMDFRSRNPKIRNKSVRGNTKQCYLRLIYDAKTFIGEDDIYPMSIISYALGGSTYSHLFRIVREKYGLCYSVDCELYGASGILIVNAEIRKENKEKTIEAIKESISTVLDCMDIEKIKRLLIISNESKYDSEGAYLTETLRRECFPEAYDDPYYKERIGRVTMEDVRRVCDKLKEEPFILSYGGDSLE